ncbi:MAG: 50S ribosomal protein L15e [Candidatus Woesearchaeota archaeon]|nr:50S ribosomal protein L15e [Candidatus Woesearchaeota archaeon]MDP7181475.1 50S ribosomal protein L15e [Candidatus Woesearchaeota archaeon]MDP7198517.1 50S ribosomal protein L15e [Candidatus Woesearchaeota archaeon]MDP7466741.1 50S ribosomal protein L15e [Candidatus Woesearchaeota archaeon]MDP7647966.1 50S ribosomal protein L15e [Candidatus Woesearchaeota archaeon]
MSLYTRMRLLWKKPKQMAMWRERIMAWRRDASTVRLERPTRLDRARSLGYKPIKGLFVVRQTVIRGPHKKSFAGGHRSKNKTGRLNLRKNYQVIAEQRAGNAFPNTEVLNSYWVGQDGIHAWYEVILADPQSPDVKARMPHLENRKGRVNRGLTSAGKKVRGMRGKGKGREKARPSRRANKRKQ